MSNYSTIVEKIFNHIVLPPRLPGHSDKDVEVGQVNNGVIQLGIEAAETLGSLTSDDYQPAWRLVERSLELCGSIHANGYINRYKLMEAFKDVGDSGLMLHVSKQNAGLLILPVRSESDEHTYVVECFEAAPMSQRVLACTGALKCDYPASAVTIPADVFQGTAFQEAMATFLEQASEELIERFAAKAKKASASVIEPRNTPAPHLITQMLMALLEAHGSQHASPILRKRIRDEVCWNNAYLPWRRSPFYLVIRVCIQRILYAVCGPDEGRGCYKVFIAMMHACLLQKATGILPVESRHFIRAKLCRRLSKLEADRSIIPCAVYSRLLDMCSPQFTEIIRRATMDMEMEWKSFKGYTQRCIPSLPLRAHQDDMRLQLPNSSSHLRNILQVPIKNSLCLKPGSIAENLTSLINANYQRFVSPYCAFYTMQNQLQTQWAVPNDKRIGCGEIARWINSYINRASNLLDGMPEEKSVMMLDLFELWVIMDKNAVRQFPLLAEYSCGFQPELLDVLHLSLCGDLVRLQKIQQYVTERERQSKFKSFTIFSNPCPGGFSDRYVRLSADKERFEQLRQEIEEASAQARMKKQQELEHVNRQYSALSKLALLPCTRNPGQARKMCSHCDAKKKRGKLVISAHEDFLPVGSSPMSLIQKRAILFEFAMPAGLAEYRDTTWRILSQLGKPEHVIPRGPAVRGLLRQYGPLKSFNQHQHLRFHLGSRTKSFLVSHYKGSALPASRTQVLLPFGLDFYYYDTDSNRWADELSKSVSFAHHFPLHPCVLELLNVQKEPNFAVNTDGRTSYEIITRQNEYPASITMHEYTSSHSLLNGKATRWLSLLRELGSSNLNFSLEATMHLVNYLALQVGPGVSGRPLRLVHRVFEEPEFCHQLATQAENILDRIHKNWRESFCIEFLLTLILRIVNLGPQSAQTEGFRLLHRVRYITFEWAQKIQQEIEIGATTETADRLSIYGLLAGLLCKRTFSIFHDDDTDIKDIQVFLAACLLVQENLQDPAKLSVTIRALLVRDLRTFSMNSFLGKDIMLYTESFGPAIETVWPNVSSVERSYSPWKVIRGLHGWTESVISSSKCFKAQIVHYHPIYGHLLVDGRPIGKLPPDYRNSPSVQELFGHEHLLIFPSAMTGMEFTLAAPRNGHSIHFGRRKKEIIVRAYVKGNLLQLVPRGIFGVRGQADLPAPLITDCFHWLNLQKKQIEIRRRKHMWWFNRSGNWMIDLVTRQASYGIFNLVDPHGNLFHRIAEIFDKFEDRQNITVLQPSSRNLLLEMKRMDLTFSVNAKGYLVCRQLHAEIDPDQDAGTWYGLQSKLVLRETSNRLKRSVVVPIGSLRYRRHGPHVLVEVNNDGRYGQFFIDSTLGRLKCEPEPELIYTKSLLHAYTSFPLPDPLTGRTGTEEALSHLTSALSSPWNPGGVSYPKPLIALAQLSPKRFYYPEYLKRQEQTFWNDGLTVTIQHNLYRPIIEAMATKIGRLEMFAQDKCHQIELEACGEPYLSNRNYFHRRNFERSEVHIDEIGQPKDSSYYGLHTCEANAGRENVYEVVHILTCRPSYIQTPSLAAIFNGATHIAGRAGHFHKDSLSETLEADLIQEWGPLTELCRQSSEDQYGIIFKLATIAFGSDMNMGLLRTLAAICIYDNLRSIRIPPHNAYINFQLNQKPSLGHIKELAQSSSEVSRFSPEHVIEKAGLPPTTTLREVHALFEEEIVQFSADILHQWPREDIVCPSCRMRTFHTAVVPKSIGEHWMRIFSNSEFGAYLSDIQRILDTHHTDSIISVPECIGASKQYPILSRAATVPTMASLLLKAGPGGRQEMQNVAHGHLWRNKSDGDATLSTVDTLEHHSGAKVSHEIQKLKTLVKQMTSTTSKQRQEYAHNLKDSINFLESHEAHRVLHREHVGLRDLESMVPIAQHSVQQQFLALVDSLTEPYMRYKWLSAGQLWPCLTPVTILQHLRSSGQQRFGVAMENALLDYGVSITQLQQLLRICDAVKKGDTQCSKDEYENIGHENWKPKEFPDWLLMEIDANIMIRKTQVDVALATISPTSGSNSVLQMNMGQGKTSVVMPMALCVLANGKTLGRLMVPKSLLLQTAQTIQSRLGDLVGREVLHIPFSRQSPVEPAAIQEYKALHEDTLNRSGIILTLPEHVLSFKLSGFQCLSDSKLESAGAILSANSWLTRVCRGVIDECDFSLAVKTQLIYPSGSQLSLDGHPHRWRTAHTLLGLVDEHLKNLENEFARSLEVVRRSNGGFPFIYILKPDVEEALHTRLIDDLCSGKTKILPTIRRHDEEAVKEFIRNGNVEDSVCQAVQQAFHGDPIALKNLYLLRGLIVHNILLLCLKKRWNVEYGLHPSRSPIAVPFHAKGVPSEQAEWGHPDVAIVLTYLTFYYGGLSIDQLGQCLQSLSQSDDPSGEYDRWGAHVLGLPESLRHWNLISIDDDMQVREVWAYLRYTVIVINYFLDHCVFPIHAKQFSQRLQLSGWDIPSFSTKETDSSMLTTGFSGTNDDRFLLPLTIKQNDLPALAHTNAEVLSYLLHPRNRSYVVASQQDGKRLTEEQFIRKLYSMGIRILIDAGAHILEYGNQGLARKRLEIDYKAPAAVYFDSGNKPWVIDRNHKEVPLLASSFANDLDKCLVFLDEAHTRGTDLKFSPSARGALTLSLGQTKDHTVQAAMRLRQLGTSQSVVFVATPEVHQSVLDFRQKVPRDAIDSADVIAWLLEQTCCHHEQLKYLYVAQGYDFCCRTDAAFVNNKFLTKTTHREAFLNILLQNEKHSLEEIYNPRPKTDHLLSSSAYVLPQIANFGANLDSQRLSLPNLSITASSSTSAFAEVEQERECMHHVEEVREVQQPTRLKHAVFPGLHAAIREFALTGRLVGQDGYEPAFTALRRTSIGIKHHLQIEQQSRLFISTEFTRTLKLLNNKFWREDFLRTVQWLLWSPSTSTALILIPEEAECVLSLIRARPSLPTHLLVYAAPFSKNMLHFNSLDFYAYPTLPKGYEFPSILKIELGLFSGRLFFTYEEYLEVLHYLDQHDGSQGSREGNSFLSFLQEWLSMTRKGRDFTHTPMGYVCQNRHLKSDHPAFAVRAADVDVTENLSNLQLDTQEGDDSGDEDIYWDVDD